MHLVLTSPPSDGMDLSDRTANARADYPVEGAIYFAKGETTAEQVKDNVERIIKTIPHPVPIPPNGHFENCLDCAKHGFEALANDGYISHDTLQKFNTFYAANIANVRTTTDAHSRKTLDDMMGGESSSGSESSKGSSHGRSHGHK